jgi:sigma-54 dependent transcriptional regulator, acetoin dehydrogenase operon transcriptional activator AcoR
MELTSVTQPLGRLDATLTTQSLSRDEAPSSAILGDELVLLLECARPLGSSMRFRLSGVDEVIIGRGVRRRCERIGSRLVIEVPDACISTVHATIRREGKTRVITDNRSTNGLVVNRRLVARGPLRDGDVIECGRTFFLFRVARPQPADQPLDVDCHGADEPPGLTTLCEPLAAQLRALPAVARTSLPLLILGATGTGKELVARAVHALSRRCGALVGVNCGALPENLAESELFGAKKGAFTGADDDKLGLVRASDQGTLFLDEIGELSLRAQATLLRVLQEREVMSLGATRAQAVDLRVVAATHRDLDGLMQEGRFRADLMARLSAFVVQLPPLTERLEDIGIVVATLLARHAPSQVTIGVDAMRALIRYDWPRNIRQLEHCLRTALALCPTRIELAHLPSAVVAAAAVPSPPPPPATLVTPPRAKLPAVAAVAARSRVLTADQLDNRERLRSLLVQHGGNISAVARDLEKDRVQIRRWIRQYGLDLHDLQR